MTVFSVNQLIVNIIAAIYTNISNDIDGDLLQEQLEDMVDSLNQAEYDPAIGYNEGQQIVFNDGGTLKAYLCTSNTTAGQSPTTTPGSWDLVSATGIVLDEIVSDITALKAVTGYSDEDQALVNSTNGLYQFDAASVTPGDDDDVVTPDNITEPAPGRWLKSKILVDTSLTGSTGDLITTTQADLVAAINEVANQQVRIVENITALKAIPTDLRSISKIVTVKYYDEGDEDAVSGGVRRAMFFKYTDTGNTYWQDLDYWQQLEPVVTADFTTTVTVGGVDAGTSYVVGDTLESIIKAILTPYQPPSISSFTLNSTPTDVTIEVGATIDVDDAVIAVTNDSDGNPPLTLYISGDGFNSSAIVGTNQPTPDPTEITNTTDMSQTWQASGTDKNSDPINTPSVSRNWYFLHAVGASSTILTALSTDGEATTVIDALQIGVLRSGISGTITATAPFDVIGNYTYIAYAAKYGDITSIIQNGSAEVIGAFTKIADFNYTNSESHIQSYRIYISNSDKAFTIGDQLAIS